MYRRYYSHKFYYNNKKYIFNYKKQLKRIERPGTTKHTKKHIHYSDEAKKGLYNFMLEQLKDEDDIF